MIAVIWAVERLALETWLQRYWLMFVPAADEVGVVASVTQYLPLSSLVHTACWSGVNA